MSKTLAEIKAAFLKPNYDNTMWDPKIEDIIAGELLPYRMAHTKFGDRQIVCLQTKTGIQTLWQSKVLMDEINHQDILPGDDIAIMYKGLKKVNGKYDMKIYRVIRVREEVECELS